MTATPNVISPLVEYSETHLGEPEVWWTPDDYPTSLELKILNSVYSTGSKYSSLLKVSKRYQSVCSNGDGARAPTQSIQKTGGARRWAFLIARDLRSAHTSAGVR